MEEVGTKLDVSYPELKPIMNDFLSNVLSHKPEDVYSFARHYFSTFHSNTPQKLKELRPVVICGPSGVGKGTLITMLLKEHPEKFGFSVSHTTRKPREGEVDGVHYHFTTLDKIQHEIQEGKFVEHANVHGNIYGTSKAAVESVLKHQKVCILDIDVQGAEQVKKSTLNPYYIFISPPSIEDLEKRLKGRGTETEETMQRRLKNARGEMEYLKKDKFWDLVIVNDEVHIAYKKLHDFIFGVMNL